MDEKQKKRSFILLIIMAPLFFAAMVFLIMLLASDVSLLSDIGLLFVLFLLIYAIVELVFLNSSLIKNKKMGRKEERARKSVAVFLAIFAFSVLVAEVYPPFTDNPVETIFLLLAFSYAVSEIVVYFLWSGDENKEAYEQPVRLSVIITLFMILLLVMLAILCLVQPVKVSPAAVADETRATTFITHPTKVIESATTEEWAMQEELPATGTIIDEISDTAPSGLSDLKEDVSAVIGRTEAVEKPDEPEVSGEAAFEEVMAQGPEQTAETTFPEDPASPGITAVPEAPVMAMPPFAIVYDAEETVSDEDDFWADFYIAGEDELVLEDGIYYMNLNVDDVFVGVVATLVENGDIFINTAETEGYVSGYLTDMAKLRIFRNDAEYIGLGYLEDCGVETDCNFDTFDVYLYFSNDDMPVRIINISSSGRINQFRPVTGALQLSPAFFVLSSDYSLYLNARGVGLDAIKDSLNAGLYINNDFRLGRVYGSFNYSLSYADSKVLFNIGSYNMYTDFQDGLYRLSWGNISSYELSPEGTTLGIKINKYRESLERRKSQIEEVLTIEKRSDVTIYNEGREIYRKTLDVGNYLLRDFVLYTGANRIKIIIEPLDGSPPREMELNINFSSSLLAPGEMTWGVGIFTGRKLVPSSSSSVSGAVRIPWFRSQAWEYDIRNLVLSGTFDIGILENLSLSASMGLKNKVTSSSAFNLSSSGSFELTHANVLGTTKYNLDIDEKLDSSGFYAPDLNFRLSHQVYTGWDGISVFNSSVAYSGRFSDKDAVRNTISLSSSVSGRAGMLGWSLSGYYTWGLDAVSKDLWMLSSSISVPLGNKVSLSGSLGYSGREAASGAVYGSVGMSLRLGPASINASSDIINSTSLNMSISEGRHYFYANAGITDWMDPSSYSLGANYRYSGRLLDFGINVATRGGLEGLSYSANLGLTSLFADGMFTFVPSRPNNFILIRQKGNLKGNKLSVGMVGSSYSEEIDSMFGIGIYQGLSLGNPASLSIFSLNEDAFGGAVSFDVTIPGSELAGYVITLEAEKKYVYSGIVLLPDGNAFINGSSPVYRYIASDDGGATLEESEYYLFTDETGRFILSDLEAGTYAFDVLCGDFWYMVVFEVGDDSKTEGVNMVVMDGSYEEIAMEPYSGIGHMVYMSNLSSDDFWNMLYPQEVL